MSEVRDVKSVIGDYDEFLDDVLLRMTEAGLDLDDFSQADHICYRVASIERYTQMQQQLMPFARLLGEVSVSGRPISTYKLDSPIHHGQWRVDALELPAPKPSAAYPEGLEHAEFVLYDDMATFLQKYPHLEFDLKSAERGINPEIGLKLGNRAVKFHLLSLTHVVYLEDKLGVEVK